MKKNYVAPDAGMIVAVVRQSILDGSFDPWNEKDDDEEKDDSNQ